MTELTVNLEDDRDNMRALFGRPVGLPLAVTVFGPLPVLLSRIPVRGVRSGSVLRSDRRACVLQIRERGLEGHAQAMAELGRPSLRPGTRVT